MTPSPKLLMPLLALLALPAVAEPPTITLPLPQGQSMEFSLIPVSVPAAGSKGLFASFAFEQGDPRQTDYQQQRTWGSVSGTIFHEGKWVIPVARTEVTRAQYCSLLSPDSMPDFSDGFYPQTNISVREVQGFLDALNKWLCSDPAARKALAPLRSNYHGKPFARLPLQAEWEFAARGGREVDSARFASGNPYADLSALADAEVLSVRQVARVKSQKVCNPCGLYDMLGNVSEMVQQPFFPEYSFGRCGALLACGANHASDVAEALAFYRREYDAYREDGYPNRSKQLGFRPVLGASIYTTKLGLREIEGEWSDYVSSDSSRRLTATPSVDKSEAGNSGDSQPQPSAEAQLNALVAVSVASARESTRTPQVLSLYWEVYQECCQRLASLDAALVTQELEMKENELSRLAPVHLPFFRVARRHYERYRQSLGSAGAPRKLSTAERRAWEADLRAAAR